MLCQIMLASFLTICSVTDILKKQIYIKVIIPFMAAGICFFVINKEVSLPEELGGIFLGLVILFIARISAERIGYGDGLMVMVSGAFLGLFMNIRLLMWAFFISAIASAILLAAKKVSRNTSIPFAPFLLVSYFLMTFLK